MIREAVASALHSGLKDSSERETPVDRLRAFSAGGSRLGTLLWRLKYANDQMSYKAAALLISRELPRNVYGNTRRKIAEWALYEWCFPMCRTCLGAKEVLAGELMIQCRTCEGRGSHRYTDREREMALGSSKFGPLLGQAAKVIKQHDMETAVVTLQRLDRPTDRG